MVNFPNEIFKLVLGFCNDTSIKKHNKKMKMIIKDIDLFTDVYSMILKDYILSNVSDDFNNEVVDEHFDHRKKNPTRLTYFIDHHEFDTQTFNYGLINIWKIGKTLIYKHIDQYTSGIYEDTDDDEFPNDIYGDTDDEQYYPDF